MVPGTLGQYQFEADYQRQKRAGQGSRGQRQGQGQGQGQGQVASQETFGESCRQIDKEDSGRFSNDYESESGCG